MARALRYSRKATVGGYDVCAVPNGGREIKTIINRMTEFQGQSQRRRHIGFCRQCCHWGTRQRR